MDFNYYIIIMIIVFMIIAGFAKGVMDKLQFHYEGSVFEGMKNQNFWNPELSWKNKWKHGNPNLGEKFLGSSGALVWLTDGWHLFQMIFLQAIFIIMMLTLGLDLDYSPIVIIICMVLGWNVAFKGMFELTFKYLLKKRK